ncbi:VAMP5 protein, partial [Rhagologus leucostigma]|nr:VAMP5 protein [Rhagologus leucostigma]
SETGDPPGSGCPGAGAGAGPGPPPGSPCRREGRGPGGWWEVARKGLNVSPCPCVSRPRVSRASPAVPRGRGVPVSALTPQCSCVPPRSPSSGGPVPTISPVSPRCPHIVPPCPQAGLARCQREAEEVAELMRQNVARALEREGHLEQLQSRAQDLRQASEAFTRTTQTVTRRQRRRQRRWHLVALGLGLLLLFILGLALALALARSSPGTVASTVPTPRGETKHPPSTAGTL